jgi:hypothetical protein
LQLSWLGLRLPNKPCVTATQRGFVRARFAGG